MLDSLYLLFHSSYLLTRSNMAKAKTKAKPSTTKKQVGKKRGPVDSTVSERSRRGPPRAETIPIPQAVDESDLRPRTRGRPRLPQGSNKSLAYLQECRDALTKKIEEDPLKHEYVRMRDCGIGRELQQWCGDCQFKVETGEIDKDKKKQGRFICLHCSFHWRAPSQYVVCDGCRAAYPEDLEGGREDGVVDEHTYIYLVDEPRFELKREYAETKKAQKKILLAQREGK